MSYDKTKQTTDKKKIVILGAGFGGVYTYQNLYKKLRKDPGVELTLVNDNNYFLFTPMLHEVATGNITPINIVEPLRKILKTRNSEFHMGRVEGVNLKERQVKTSSGTISYDYLVVALGAETNYHNVPGAKENSFELKDLSDAIAIKSHIIETFEAASLESDTSKRAAMLNFVVVGGGPTGVELAAEMADLFHDSMKAYYEHEMMHQVKVSLISSGPELLQQFSPSLRERSLKTLEGKNVSVHLGVNVTELSNKSVTLSTGETIATNTVVWAAGVKPFELSFDQDPDKERGRILVNDKLQMRGHKEVFVLGDMAACKNPGEERALPMTAQVATRQAKGVAKNIINSLRGKDLEPFVYKHQGSFVSLGDWMAVGEVGRMSFFGHLAWWLWRTIYLSKLISWQKKLQVALDWTINLFSPRDISELYKCPRCSKKG